MIRASKPIPQATTKCRSCTLPHRGRSPARQAEIEGAVRSRADRRERPVHAADPERPGQHVAGPGRHDRQRHATPGQGGGGIPDRAVAADRHDEGAADGVAERGEGRVVVVVARSRVERHRPAARRQPRRRGGCAPAEPDHAGARPRVDDDERRRRAATGHPAGIRSRKRLQAGRRGLVAISSRTARSIGAGGRASRSGRLGSSKAQTRSGRPSRRSEVAVLVGRAHRDRTGCRS